MRDYTVKTIEGKELTFQTPEPNAKFATFFAFSLPKAGSVLFFNILDKISYYNQIPYVSLPDIFYEEGCSFYHFRYDWNAETIKKMFQDEAYSFCGFREFPEWLKKEEIINNKKKMLLVRDPRDVLVSWYFHLQKSMIVPQQETEYTEVLQEYKQTALRQTVDQFVLEKKMETKAQFLSYQNLLGRGELLKVFRYEDIIFSKKQWLEEIVEFLGLKLTEEQILSILEAHDIIPTEENINNHIRQVKPGDYQNKLQLETIQELNLYFEEILDQFNYLH